MLPLQVFLRSLPATKTRRAGNGVIIVIILLFSHLFISDTTAQANLDRIEYYIDTDPGFGRATTVSGIGTTTNLVNKVIAINPTSLAEGVHRLYVRAHAGGNWSLTNTLLFYKPYGGGVTPPTPPPPSNIARIEYYLDTDPGFGAATALSIGTGTDIQDAIIPVDPTPLAEGVHRLYVRALNATGNWSLTNTWLFYKPYGNGTTPAAPPVAQLSKLEYYIDSDPGYGKGIPVALDSVTDIANYIVPINVTGSYDREP